MSADGALVTGLPHGADALQRRECPRPIRCWYPQFDDRVADAVLELVAGAFADQAAVVDDGDPVGEPFGLLCSLPSMRAGPSGRGAGRIRATCLPRLIY